MSKKQLIWICIIWLILTVLNYYYVPYFILAFEWFFLSAFFFIMTIIQVISLIIERKEITRKRIYSLIVISSIFILTFSKDIPNLIIEKVDWIIFVNKRTEIIEQVRKGELKPNVEWNGWVCELPFEFPIVSNGGNDIGIYRNEREGSLTVTFWIFRNYFEQPSTYLVYTEDKLKIERLEKKINQLPNENWKIRDNWYRVLGEY